MSTYTTCLLRCAHCGSSSPSSVIASYSTAGAISYSDGFMRGGGLAIDDLAVRCPQCGIPALKDELDVDTSKNWKALPRQGRFRSKKSSEWQVVHPESLAAAKFWKNDDQEFAIRMAVWHRANHRDRKRPRDNPPRSVEEVDNVRALERLLDDTQIADRILSAEIYRELGLFAACIWKLQSCTSPDFDWVVRPIREAAAAGVTTVIRLD